MDDRTASEQIDEIIKRQNNWKGDLIGQLRRVIKTAYPEINEEIKWKMRTRPEGLPVWSVNGIVCYVEIWKDNIKLIFFKGSEIDDVRHVFNARLKSASVRAIEFHEGDEVDDDAIRNLVQKAVQIIG